MNTVYLVKQKHMYRFVKQHAPTYALTPVARFTGVSDTFVSDVAKELKAYSALAGWYYLTLQVIDTTVLSHRGEYVTPPSTVVEDDALYQYRVITSAIPRLQQPWLVTQAIRDRVIPTHRDTLTKGDVMLALPGVSEAVVTQALAEMRAQGLLTLTQRGHVMPT